MYRILLPLTVVAVVAVLAAPAGAATTTTTFALTSGALSITVPATADLGSADAANGTLSASLGTVRVDDARGSLTASWTATVVSTAFTTGTATADETIAATELGYNPGLGTIISGAPVLTPGVLIDDLSTAKTAMSATAVGSNAASWAPTFSVDVPADAVAGTYSGTVTHSVS